MSDEAKKLLTDILESIALIEQYTAGKLSFEHYAKDRQLKDAVERRLEIIGEATKPALSWSKWRCWNLTARLPFHRLVKS